MAAPLSGANVLKHCCFRIFGVRSFCRTAQHCEIQKQAAVQESHNVNKHLCRTSETDITLHTHDHGGLFFELSESDRDRFYTKGQSRHLGRMFKAFHESCIMVRKPMLDIKSLLNAADYDLPVIRYILYGRLGAGKSLTLAYLLHHCAVNDWLLIHLPWAAQFTRSWREYQVSPFQQGKIDNPIESADWLSYFYSLNKPFIEKHQPVVENSYTWTKRESVEAGTPWTEVIDFGISRNKYAADAVGILFKEIKKQASDKRFKVLVAIDGVNTFWEPTTIKREDDRKLMFDSSDLTIVHYFKKLLQNDWRNGAVVCTVDERASTTFKDASPLPLYLLGQKGFEFFNPFIPIEVPNYSEKEAYSQIDYFLQNKWIQNPKGSTEEGMREIMFLSNKNPYEMYRVTRNL